MDVKNDNRVKNIQKLVSEVSQFKERLQQKQKNKQPDTDDGGFMMRQFCVKLKNHAFINSQTGVLF